MALDRTGNAYGQGSIEELGPAMTYCSHKEIAVDWTLIDWTLVTHMTQAAILGQAECISDFGSQVWHALCEGLE